MEIPSENSGSFIIHRHPPRRRLARGDEKRWRMLEYIMWESNTLLSEALNWKRQDLIWYQVLSPH